jgi:hypothetical protein
MGSGSATKRDVFCYCVVFVVGQHPYTYTPEGSKWPWLCLEAEQQLWVMAAGVGTLELEADHTMMP